jgi:NAD-dependent dihydropyrimidine dehydrogenase PreA subunit
VTDPLAELADLLLDVGRLIRALTPPAADTYPLTDTERSCGSSTCSPDQRPARSLDAGACSCEGARALYIHPDECVNCGACEPVCPVEAIYYEDDVPEQWSAFTADNARFFTEPLPGRSAPLGAPGGAAKTGRVGADTPLVFDYPSRA